MSFSSTRPSLNKDVESITHMKWDIIIIRCFLGRGFCKASMRPATLEIDHIATTARKAPEEHRCDHNAELLLRGQFAKSCFFKKSLERTCQPILT